MSSDTKTSRAVYTIIQIATAVVAFWTLISVNMASEKQLIILLPLSYLILNLIFRNNYSEIDHNITKALVFILYFIRFVVQPALYSSCLDTKLYVGTANISDSFNQAIAIMIYEYIAINLAIFLFDHTSHNFSNFITIKTTRNTNLYSGIVVLLSLFAIGTIIWMPDVLMKFKTIFSLSDINFSTLTSDSSVYESGSLKRAISTLFSMAFKWIRILLPVLILQKIKIKHVRGTLGSKLVLLLFLFLQFVFISSTFAEAIVAALVITLFYSHLFPEDRKSVYLMLIISTVGIILLYFLVRFNVSARGMYTKNQGLNVYFAQILNAYFSGVDNVAASFNIPDGHRLEALLSNIRGSIPFNTFFFHGDGHSLQYYFNSCNGSSGQIQPTIGAGRYFVGPILAPILSQFLVWWSLYFTGKANSVSQLNRYVPLIFNAIIFALGVVMYNETIALTWFLSWGVPMMIVAVFYSGDESQEVIE